MPIPYKPEPHQQKFHKSKAKYRLFGGAKGPGKSYAMMWEAVETCKRIDKCNVLMIQRTYPEIERGIMRLFETSVPPSLYGGLSNFNRSKHTVLFPNGSKLYFGSAQHEDDIYQYNGQEFVAIYIDESTEFTYEMFDYLTLNNRCPIKIDNFGKPVRAFMALASNPVGIGKKWHKQLFIDKNPTGEFIDPKLYDPSQWEYIPANIYQNPIYANDRSYIATLESKSLAWRRAYLEGSWLDFGGGYFDRADMALVAIESELVLKLIAGQPWQPIWMGIDWGFRDHTAVYWATRLTLPSYTGATVTPIVIFRELVVNQTDETDLGRLIASECITPGSDLRSRVRAVFLSVDAFAKRSSANTIAERLGKSLVDSGLPYPEMADNDRVGGWRLMDELMVSTKVDPDLGLRISTACPQLLEALPVIERSKLDPNDVQIMDKRVEEDITDAARYTVKSYMGENTVPEEVKRAQLLADCPNNQSRFFTDLQLRTEKKKAKTIVFGRQRRFPTSFRRVA
jgi:hypothetical protein